jgi:tRNA pseudouridine55 synthase
MTTTDVAKPSGILLVDKPVGISSARAVATTKRALGGTKVGHLGTLDPFASGLLPLCVGEGTKVAQYLNLADKTYRGVIRLGVETDTLDRTGETIAESPVPDLRALDLEALAGRFTGEIDQVPPAFSAIKRDGVRMYKLAREGKAPELEPRRVTVYALELAVLDETRLSLRAACSKGTYIRSLARDIGREIGCGGTLEELVRTGFGRFALDRAVSLDAVESGTEPLEAAIVSVSDALSELRRLMPGAAVSAGLRTGQQRWLADLEPPAPSERLARVVDEDGRLVAVVRADHGRWTLDRVFN